MKTAIRKNLRNFLAIIGLVVLAMFVGGYILGQERLKLPGWVPFVGQSFYTIKAEFQTGQALTPGQGQTVDVAGVPIGEISEVDLVGGRALVTMQIQKRYDAIYPDAQMLLRPKTGLKDMIVELDPGNPTSGRKLPSGSTLPVSQTLPDINLDQILGSLDADSRDYLKLLLAGAGQGLSNGGGRELAQAFRRFNPTARNLDKIASKVSQRRVNLRRLVHNFQLLATALGGKDQQLAQLVDSSNGVFRNLAAQDANLRQTIALLPGTLATTKVGLDKADALARQLGPTLQSLRPAARSLAPALRATRPFLRESTPIIRDQIRPFTRVAQPTVQLLRPAARRLADLTPDLRSTAKVVNYLLNEVAYNPPGEGVGKEGYLFWVGWDNHDANSVFSFQDANGTIRRGLLVSDCSTLSSVLTGVPLLFGKSSLPATLLNLLRLPDPSKSPLCHDQQTGH